MLQKLSCMLVYAICIQTYHQVSIPRICSKIRLHRVVLLRFGLKMPNIALNIMKVSMHSYLPNVPINLRLNFNFEKLVKRENPLCGFAKVGLKGGDNILECLKSLHVCLLIKLASKFMIKFKF